jgi:hypothetical protein
MAATYSLPQNQRRSSTESEPLPDKLSAVTVAFEIEVHMQNSTFKCALKTFLVRIFPFFVYNAKSLSWKKQGYKIIFST